MTLLSDVDVPIIEKVVEKAFQIKSWSFFILYETNRFHVAVHLFSNRSQRTSKCGKNISGTRGDIGILGIGLELACNVGSCGGISLKGDQCHLHLNIPFISLSCKLVPVPYWKYKYSLLTSVYSCICTVIDHEFCNNIVN